MALSEFIMCGHKFYWIEDFGEELNELTYEGLSNWFASFRPLNEVFEAHFSYLIVHLSIIACGVFTLKHAKTNGSRFVQFWWGAMIHGLLSEVGFSPPRRWHAQAPIMLFGKRLPLHMVFFYPTLLYLSLIGIRKFELTLWSESTAVGMLAMIMVIPFRMVSVKFLHITYHDSDPIYSSKFYGVPWIELFCDLIFATSYITCHYLLKCDFISESYIKWKAVSYKKKDKITTAASGMVSPLSAFVQKVVFFHLLHDVFNINVQTCLLFLIAAYFFVVMCCRGKPMETDGRCRKACKNTEGETDNESEDEDEDEEEEERERKDKTGHCMELDGKNFLYFALYIYLGCLLYLGLFGTPQNEVSIGAHEPTGDCTTFICTKTPLGKTLKRRKYLCIDDVQERRNFVYDFSCLPDGPPSLNAIWYTICGTPIRNRAQFFTNIFSFILLIMSIFLSGLVIRENENRDGCSLWKLTFLQQFFRAGERRRGMASSASTADQREANEDTAGEAA